ncbi:MAG: PKD domain-containing protein [Flavobacteriales bacterium]
MKAIRTLAAFTGLLLAVAARPQWPCDSLLHASFTAAPDPTQDRVIHFDNTSWTALGSNATYLWSFGDGQSASWENAVHQYAAPGTYTACLWVVAGHCSDSVCMSVVVGNVVSPCSQLDAGFSMTNDGLTAHFLNSSPLNTVAYEWSFGDSTYATGRDLYHTYSQYGQYEVCLKARTWDPITQAFCTVDHCGIIHLMPDTMPKPCDLLDSSFTVSLQGPVASFRSSMGSNEIGYIWSFGDGTASQEASPTHTYAQPGRYYTCMTATAWDPHTQDVCRVDHCQWIVIPGDSIGPSPCDGLSANFQATVDGHTASFHQGPTTDAVYQWSFGDGTTAYGPNPGHTYARPGQYQVCLWAWALKPGSQDTCFDHHCATVTIIGDTLDSCNGLNAGFQVTTQGNVASFHNNEVNGGIYHWSFGDGASGFGRNPSHAYAQPGQYRACLVIWTWNPVTQDTCFADQCEWVMINGGSAPCDSLLHMSFSYDQQEGNVTFTGISTLPGTSFSWNFGDGSFGNGSTVQHTYAPGQYEVCLQGWYAGPDSIAMWDSCFATYCRLIVVQRDSTSSPCHDLNAGFQVTIQESTAAFHSSNVNIAAYLWTFGDGTTGHGPNPTHTYAQPGRYHACLSTWTWDPATQDTCFADHCEWVMIPGNGSPCDSLFTATFTYTQQNGHVALSGSASLPAFFSWTLGDGTTATGPVVQHTYAPGQYTVCLFAHANLFNGGTVSDSCFTQYCYAIVVAGDSTHSPCHDLNAGFHVTTQGSTAAFHSSNVNTAAYQWTFGDGTTGQGPNSTHTYAQPGQYHACLSTWAWNPATQDTCFADHCEWVAISGAHNPCDSAWVLAFDRYASDTMIVLTSNADGLGLDVSAAWFANGQPIGTGPQVTYQPTTSEPFVVCLELGLYDSTQVLVCSGTVCDTVGLLLSTGIDEAGRGMDVNVYPQPFTGQLVVNARGLTGTTRATLLDPSGRLVDDRQVSLNGPTVIDYTALASGIYVLRLQNAAGERTVRVLKN